MIFKVYGKPKLNHIEKQYIVTELVEFTKVVTAKSKQDAVDSYYQLDSDSRTLSIKAKRKNIVINKNEQVISGVETTDLQTAWNMINEDRDLYKNYKSIRIEQTDLTDIHDVFKK